DRRRVLPPAPGRLGRADAGGGEGRGGQQCRRHSFRRAHGYAFLITERPDGTASVPLDAPGAGDGALDGPRRPDYSESGSVNQGSEISRRLAQRPTTVPGAAPARPRPAHGTGVAPHAVVNS